MRTKLLTAGLVGFLAISACTASDGSDVVIRRAPVAPACYILTFADSSQAPSPFAVPPVRLALLAPSGSADSPGSVADGPARTSVRPTREPGPSGTWRLIEDGGAEIRLGAGEAGLQLRVRAERIGYAGTLLAGVGREGAAERDSMPVDVRLVECAAMGF